MALTATAGSATADSFITVAAADLYFDTRLNVTAWTAAVTADKERALKSATREITASAFIGLRTDDVQALAWPRDGAERPDAAGITDAYYDDTEIPVRVLDATCELALAYLNAGTTDLTLADSTAGVIRKQIGPIDTSWALGERPIGWSRFPAVTDALSPLLSSAGTAGTWERS